MQFFAIQSFAPGLKKCRFLYWFHSEHNFANYTIILILLYLLAFSKRAKTGENQLQVSRHHAIFRHLLSQNQP